MIYKVTFMEVRHKNGSMLSKIMAFTVRYAYEEKELEAKAQISNYAMRKLAKDEDVSTEVLGKICKALNCSLDDIVEFIDEDK